jgi:Ni/Co efflux regulator RcnB
MIKKALVFAVSAACLMSGAAFAQSNDYRNDRNDRYERSAQSDRYNRDVRDSREVGRRDGYRDARSRYDNDRNDRYDRDDRRHDRRDNRYSDNRYYGNGHNGYYNGNAYGHRNHWRRGARISQDYGRYYVVDDWHQHQGLYAPQRGYHWVRTGNDFALVAITTGIIASILLSN